ncbi:hypothetical protein G6F65_018368 [Rhizopus arrhizus]|nr:hypothetical protein G6F65_018368 [Rhizopus arrhizus]
MGCPISAAAPAFCWARWRSCCWAITAACCRRPSHPAVARDVRDRSRRVLVGAATAAAAVSLGLKRHDLSIFDGPLVRLRRRVPVAQPDVVVLRRAGGQPHRRAARHGRFVGDLHPAAADLRDAARARDPDAGRHLLRFAVWRRHRRNPAQPAFASAARGHLPGRLSTDQTGQGRNRAGHHDDLLVLRGIASRSCCWACWPARRCRGARRSRALR